MSSSIAVCIESVVINGKRWIKAKEDADKTDAMFSSSSEISESDKLTVENYFDSVSCLYESVEKTRTVLKDFSGGNRLLEIAFEWATIQEFSKHLPTLMLRHKHTEAVQNFAAKTMELLGNIEAELETILKTDYNK